ncbi:hypothetical protein EII22_08845 [Coriobacteriales bacterium OH1046]|nr:hypothetical protein EII22_08845 [Coriobacteriales bacterium OH1046]
MSATDELRRLLDERGVEWGASDTYRLLVTSWKDANGHSWAFMEHRDGSFSKLTAYHLTPEQVVEATLGRGTCRVARRETDEHAHWDYLTCGHISATHSPAPPNFCPNCGRKVRA